MTSVVILLRMSDWADGSRVKFVTKVLLVKISTLNPVRSPCRCARAGETQVTTALETFTN